ncbi:phosphotriesterase [Vibrio ezurae]|uniref:Putative phosphotriesterase n=1 Tax=Vibrio ezurae NBRC 102218 TaxID=1219080 RepID=U3CT64_9VIBR|nr:phosphotriesterase [Vibrio ezurae]GAD80853.1 putative phosphotriesterase [Vibrio ezurae NBRC 102218]
MPINESGYTYCHEHLHIDLSKQKGDDDCKLDQFELISAELKALKTRGVFNIVEVTNKFMGRNPQFIEALTKETQMNILCSTGFYIEGFFPNALKQMSVVDIAKTMIHEIDNGIDDSNLRASVIGEIGSSHNVFTDTERKVFEGAAIAHLETGCPISTHTSFSTMAKSQVELLRNMKVNLNNVSIGHCDLRDNFDDILWLLDQGCYVQFDTIGKNDYYPDAKRIAVIDSLIRRGYADRVMLSMDITRKSHLKENGGLGFCYLIDHFVPMLLERGIQQQYIDLMLKHNPANFFGTTQK